MMCYLFCPEGAIYKKDDFLVIDYDFCKGCGICDYECKSKAIAMVPEDEWK
jgi:pyruvate ferredoxin oxidoreductase delta subunit